MRLKKRYTPESLKAGVPEVSHVEVQMAGAHWNPSMRIIERGQAERWLVRDGNMLSIKTAADEQDLKYKIIVPPGLYCCHCGEKCPSQVDARQHVKARHAKEKSPDAANPSGYTRHNFYMTDRVDH